MTVWILYLVIVIVIFLSIFIFLVHRKMFNPKNEILYSPTGRYEDLYLPIGNESGRHYRRSKRPNVPCINGWSFKDYGSEKTILYFHGNIGNNGHRKYVMDISERLQTNLFLVDYRGFGRSDRHPHSRWNSGGCRNSLSIST